MTTQNTFATVLGCMDGRCQEPTLIFAKDIFGADCIDTITEAGIDRVLADGGNDAVRAKAAISAEKHGSLGVLITGHVDCAGNPVSLDEHVEHLRIAKKTVESWNLFPRILLAVFDDQWNLVTIE